MKICIRFFILFVLATGGINSRAAELLPVVKTQQLGFLLANVPWPETLAKDFRSGFENRILIRVTAITDAKPAIKSNVVISEKYDLWDEVFTLKLYVENAEIKHKSVRRVDEAIKFLNTESSADVFAVSLFKHAQIMKLQADILINPVEREKLERLSQWVAENSAPQVPGDSLNNAPLTTRQNSLFNSIYQQYVHGAETIAPWKMTVSSQLFTLQELEEPRSSESK